VLSREEPESHDQGCARFFPNRAVVARYSRSFRRVVGDCHPGTRGPPRRKSGETVPILINFREKTDLGSFQGGRETAGAMIVALQETAARSQQRILAFLMRQLQKRARAWLEYA
jgi:hypothetical protein